MTKCRSFQSQSNVSTNKVICRNNWLLSYSEEDRNANHEMWFSVGVVVVFLRRRLLISSSICSSICFTFIYVDNEWDIFCRQLMFSSAGHTCFHGDGLNKGFLHKHIATARKPSIIFPYFLTNVKGNGPTFWRTFQFNWCALMSVVFLF